MLAITLAEEVVCISRHNSGICTITLTKQVLYIMPSKLLMSDCYRLCAKEWGGRLSLEDRKCPRAVSFSATTGLVSFPNQYGAHTKVWEWDYNWLSKWSSHFNVFHFPRPIPLTPDTWQTSSTSGCGQCTEDGSSCLCEFTCKIKVQALSEYGCVI